MKDVLAWNGVPKENDAMAKPDAGRKDPTI